MSSANNSNTPDRPTAEELEALRVQRNIDRFSGTRYSLQGPSRYGPSAIIPQIPGTYAFPKSDVSVEDRDD
jgi:hypothetical protein